MSTDPWLEVISRITTATPEDIDPILGTGPANIPARPHHPGGRTPSKRLWDRQETEKSFLGIRVCEKPVEITAIATKLASVAIERNVVPIILSRVTDSGFERFGFRVERVGGRLPAEQEACEAELCSFWEIVIVIDMAEVARVA